MARTLTSSIPYLRLRRQAGILAGVSLLLALLLIGYTFGVENHFFARLFSAFFVFFWLLAVTFLGIVPFVNWAARSWFGKEWTSDSFTKTAARRSSASTSPSSARTPTRTASRSSQKRHP
ncbi:hypothetical protein F1C16_14720 [Hymenobacter sp. NBH84]|uniref:DUF4175 domain-containing protein n=1 Tax=Hymenobacter defluvii TaxID=2054411 RepID=A0ABS3T894_9BACT|nr:MULTISPECIES: hypothetical protein [Hymenobacter]MBO3269852.1 hypothetical protein [Hymenobacter defluvii]QNE40729.1 hypothetical protein F1C16_14720 [Hymenobacter sp. NBH84]